MLFGNYKSGSDGAAAFAIPPHKSGKGFASRVGDVWVNIYKPGHIDTDTDLDLTPPANLKPMAGSEAFKTLLHEIGHTLGLRSPGRLQHSAQPPLHLRELRRIHRSTDQYTVMGYFGVDLRILRGLLRPATPMLHDIAAVQRIYGISTATRTGDTVYGFNSNADRSVFRLVQPTDQAVFTIWDAGGNDTLDLSGYLRRLDPYGFATTGAIIDLRPGHYSSVGELIANIAVADKPAGAGADLDYFIGTPSAQAAPTRFTATNAAIGSTAEMATTACSAVS